MQPDFEEARRFLSLLAPSEEDHWFQSYDDDKTRKDGDLAHLFHGSLKEKWPAIEYYISRGAGVGVAVNRFSNAGRRREYLIEVRAVFLEMDWGLIKDLPIKPHIQVETSPGRFHFYWLVTGCTNFDEYARVLRGMAIDYGDDAAVEPVKALRLPGTIHQKDASNPRRVRIVTPEPGRGPITPLPWEEVLKYFPPMDEPEPATFTESSKVLDVVTIQSALAVLPPDTIYPDWIKIGMALHHASGGAQAGFDLWNKWSKGSEKYNADVLNYHWQSFGRNLGRRPVGLGTLYRLAKEYGWKRPGRARADREEDDQDDDGNQDSLVRGSR